ncbi:MAG: hypothetical protein JO021_01320 [Alphaproteobacteria bacterium]|nr:hypothetical protein [Alphaproteobacteria bacterium]
MTDAFKTNWAAALRQIETALGGLVEPDLAKDAARERALALRGRLAGDTPLLTARSPGVIDTLFRPITRD